MLQARLIQEAIEQTIDALIQKKKERDAVRAANHSTEPSSPRIEQPQVKQMRDLIIFD